MVKNISNPKRENCFITDYHIIGIRQIFCFKYENMNY